MYAFLVRMGCFLRVCRLAAESYWLLFEDGQEWHHQGRRMIGHPSPRLIMISELRSGLLAISTWKAAAAVTCQRPVLQVLQAQLQVLNKLPRW